LKLKDELIVALVKEISLTPRLNNEMDSEGIHQKLSIPLRDDSEQTEIIDSVYFGGGTPSLLNSVDLHLLMEALRKRFILTGDTEITIEANPDDITPEKLTSWKLAGINRLSVGIQSFIDDELIWMNRAHTAKDSLQCIDNIKNAGFANFSVDLIYGSPLLSNDNWKKNVTTVIEKNIPHISCYALTVEPKTPLYKLINQHKKEPVETEKPAEQFLLLMSWAQQGGYEHYEISNFAKPGLRSKHNSSYWLGQPYYGFGPSAHAFNSRSRRWNIANNALYVQSLKNNLIPFEEEILTPTQKLNEYIMTSLRTMEGLDLIVIKEKFGEKISMDLKKASEKWKLGEKLMVENEKIILTRDGKLFADGIASDLFF
jgi:oxygen-independent coproporphyrinogen-3 oxidase